MRPFFYQHLLNECKQYRHSEFVSAGVFMNQRDFNMSINLCWDLIDIDERNGGNMREYIDEEMEDDESVESVD
eukprot:TRINITY_DN3194_c1_g10_i1.p3 TRINITY_DN3194_c1_g10~~TRINITY_DN3194_c1_g10_i1.p3  ORF type:complete len:73 (-),score=24.06 TRINITY_DN3194_c1_g10_i1:975-1193(-)